MPTFLDELFTFDDFNLSQQFRTKINLYKEFMNLFIGTEICMNSKYFQVTSVTFWGDFRLKSAKYAMK
ncbi:MAG: hypothetical protein CL610_13005 [Anaerolineaceae bacterium]|nr:hypothetical protein [Anaerolineaceae bacterium]